MELIIETAHADTSSVTPFPHLRRLRRLNAQPGYNLVNEGSLAIDGFALADEMSRLGFHSVLLRPEDGWEGNELLILSRTRPTINLRTQEILNRPAEARSYLLSLRAHVKRARA